MFTNNRSLRFKPNHPKRWDGKRRIFNQHNRLKMAELPKVFPAAGSASLFVAGEEVGNMRVLPYAGTGAPQAVGYRRRTAPRAEKQRGHGQQWRMVAELLVCLVFACSCSAILDGPFNQNDKMVPELLYANNGSSLVTFWDEALQTYRTYDQARDVFLKEAVFETGQEDGPGRNYGISGVRVIPLTRLDARGMHLQATGGCGACHSN